MRSYRSSAEYEIDQVAENILQESSREGIEIPIPSVSQQKDPMVNVVDILLLFSVGTL